MADVDLRPMSLGELLDRTFTPYKRNFWLFAGIVSLPYLLLMVVNVGFELMGKGGGVIEPKGGGVPSASFFLGAFLGGFIFLFFYALVTGAAHAATVFAVSDLYLGRLASVRDSYSRMGTKVFRIVWMFLLFLLVIIVSFVAIVVVAGVLRSPAIVFVGMILAFILIFIILCRAAVAVPSAMLKSSAARPFGWCSTQAACCGPACWASASWTMRWVRLFHSRRSLCIPVTRSRCWPMDAACSIACRQGVAPRRCARFSKRLRKFAARNWKRIIGAQ